MKNSTLLILVLVLLAFASCEKREPTLVTEEEYLYGYWINPVADDSLITYEKAKSFEEHGYGMAFKRDKVFLERKNAGWCGTPPITYSDYEGFWLISDSVINITVEYWGGLIDYEWKIVSVDNHHLTVHFLIEENHIE